LYQYAISSAPSEPPAISKTQMELRMGAKIEIAINRMFRRSREESPLLFKQIFDDHSIYIEKL